MKRLNLDAFKAKNAEKTTAKATNKLLEQVLGDCHDQPRRSRDSGSNRMYDTSN